MFNRARRSAKTNSVSVDSFKTLKAQKFVGGAKPFPMNPFFIPKITISDKTRTQIYSLYKSSPEQWTPRALAEQFGISIARTDAILRLKALAASMEEKVPKNKTHSAGHRNTNKVRRGDGGFS